MVRFVTELELPLTGNETVVQLKILITGHDEYDEDFVSSCYDTILHENQENLEREHERLRLANFEREEKFRQKNLERENKSLEPNRNLSVEN